MINVLPMDRAWLRGHEPILREAFSLIGDGDAYGPDEELYRDAELDPRNFILEVRDDDGSVIGCALIVFYRSPHSPITYAMNDLIFIAPSHKGRELVGGHLVYEAERVAAARGADEFRWSIPIGSPLDIAFGKPRRAKKYIPFERSYRRVLNG